MRLTLDQLGTQELLAVRNMPLMAPLIILLVKYLISVISILEIFFHALENKYYKCWLSPKTELPMIYIDDCIKATVRKFILNKQAFRFNF